MDIDSVLLYTFAGKSVICARATPKQKAMVVNSIKKRSPPNQVLICIWNSTFCRIRFARRFSLAHTVYQVTAAIGDGANDVPMIMEVPNRFVRACASNVR